MLTIFFRNKQCFISNFVCNIQGGHTGLAKPEEFTGAGWNTFVKIKADAWLNFYKDWLEVGCFGFNLFYFVMDC